MVNVFLKFRSNKIQKCGSSRLKRTTHVFKCKAPGLFWELGRELHRNNPFQRKLYGKSGIEQRLHNFMFSSAKLYDFCENLVVSSIETKPSRGSFMKKEQLSKGFTFLLHTSMGAAVLDARRCGSSRSKRWTHIFKCKTPGLFQKLIESSTETAPSSASSMEKVPLRKGSATFYCIPS